MLKVIQIGLWEKHEIFELSNAKVLPLAGKPNEEVPSFSGHHSSICGIRSVDQSLDDSFVLASVRR